MGRLSLFLGEEHRPDREILQTVSAGEVNFKGEKIKKEE